MTLTEQGKANWHPVTGKFCLSGLNDLQQRVYDESTFCMPRPEVSSLQHHWSQSGVTFGSFPALAAGEPCGACRAGHVGVNSKNQRNPAGFLADLCSYSDHQGFKRVGSPGRNCVSGPIRGKFSILCVAQNFRKCSRIPGCGSGRCSAVESNSSPLGFRSRNIDS